MEIFYQSVDRDSMAEFPQSLYEAVRNREPACNSVSHMQLGFSVELETWPHFRVLLIKAFWDIRHVPVDNMFETVRFIERGHDLTGKTSLYEAPTRVPPSFCSRGSHRCHPVHDSSGSCRMPYQLS